MTDLVQSLSTFGESILAWCIATNTSTALLLLAAFIADRILSQRVAAAWRIMFYFPVLIRVLLPLNLTWAVPFWSIPHSVASDTTSILPFAAASSSHADSAPHTSGPFWATAVTAVYILGVLGLAVLWLSDIRTVRRIIAQSSLHATVSDVHVSPVSGPMVAGVIRPRIIIPAWLMEADCVSLILAHERAHITRRDPLLVAGLRLLCTLAWPIVPAWIAAARIRALIEHACDDLALSSPSSRHQETIMKYAQALIEVADRSNHLPRSLAFGASLQSRIVSLRPSSRWPRGVQFTLTIFAASGLVACSVARPSATSTDLKDQQPALQPAETAPTPKGRATWDLRETAPAPRANNFVDAPSAQKRIINVQIMSGRAPVAGLYANAAHPKVAVASTEQLAGSLMQLTDVTILAAPRLLVHVDQPAAIEVGNDQRKFSVQLQVHPSAPGTVRATLNYIEGDEYVLKNSTLQFNKGECSVISIPSLNPATPPRTLIITIDMPGEETLFGC